MILIPEEVLGKNNLTKLTHVLYILLNLCMYTENVSTAYLKNGY